ncbi:MAG: DUF2007 domain-containing protein [Bryobacterales bacterium]|nr:DUF2007 domain-containing protein [Bryobacterales bacterium]
MFCPQCRMQYPERADCPECRIPLVENLPAGGADYVALDVLIRTDLADPIAIALAKSLLEEAGIPFFVMDQNIAARQESGNFFGWWSLRVPREREAEAREIVESVQGAR